MFSVAERVRESIEVECRVLTELAAGVLMPAGRWKVRTKKVWRKRGQAGQAANVKCTCKMCVCRMYGEEKCQKREVMNCFFFFFSVWGRGAKGKARVSA